MLALGPFSIHLPDSYNCPEWKIFKDVDYNAIHWLGFVKQQFSILFRPVQKLGKILQKLQKGSILMGGSKEK